MIGSTMLIITETICWFTFLYLPVPFIATFFYLVPCPERSW